MGLIENMGKKGAKLPVPTTAGDDQVIAAKTGEYVLPPEVVQAIGLDKLNALVQSITGQPPGGQPAEMPQMDGHPMMDAPMMGHANGGLISKFSATSKFSASPLNSDPLQDNRESLRKYGFDGGMGSDSVATEISRAAKGMPMADEVMEAGMDKMAQKTMPPQRKRLGIGDLRDLEAMGALGEDSNIMGYNKGGLIARMQGYANGGVIDDLYGETQAKRAALRNYTPEPGRLQPQPKPFPRIDELRNYNPQASIPPNATTNASPRAPELRNFTPEAGRLQPGSVGPRISGLAATPPAGTPSATVRALDARVPGDAAAVEAQRAKAAAQAGRLTGQAQSAAAAAAQPPKPGLAGRAVQTAGRIGSLAKAATPFALNAGVNQSFADLDTGYRDAFAQSVGAESPVGNAAADTARTFANIGDAVTLGLAGRVGRGIASATGGGSFGEGFASDSDRDRFLASQQPQQVAAAPQLTPQQNSDEIARRRAALEGPQAAPAPAANATPTQAAVAAPAPARGPVAGLAARAAKPAAAAPAAPVATQPMDGAVEIIRGHNRSWAVPELGYQEVPEEVYRSGKIAEYAQAQSNNMLDRADPVAAELRTRLAEIAAQGDNSIRVSNATDRDGKGRGLRNQIAEIELQQRQQIAELEKQALNGNQEAVQRIQQLNQLRSNGRNDDGRAKLVGQLANDYAGLVTKPLGKDGKTPMTMDEYVDAVLTKATGTVKSSSTAPQEGKTYTDASGNKAVFRNGQWQEVR